MNILHGLPKWLPGFNFFLQIADKSLFSRNDFCIFVLVIYLEFLPSGLEQEDWVDALAGKTPESSTLVLRTRVKLRYGFAEAYTSAASEVFIDEVVE
jgi:hypothetical protein